MQLDKEHNLYITIVSKILPNLAIEACTEALSYCENVCIRLVY